MGAGRPKWIPQYIDRVRYNEYKIQGLNDQEIADKLGICWDVLKKNKKLLLQNTNKIKRRIMRKYKKTPKLGGVQQFVNHPLMNEKMLKTFAEVGYTKRQVIDLIGCSEPTFYTYLERYPKLRKAFDLGKEYADVKVLKALMKRATGMRIPKVKFASDKGVFSDQKRYYEVLPPDTNAAFAWLINRQKWSRDNEPQRENRKGLILEAVEKMTEISEEKMKEFDK